MNRRSFIRLVSMAGAALGLAPALAPAAEIESAPLAGKPLTDIYPRGMWVYGDGSGLLGCATGVSAMQEQMLEGTYRANVFARDEWLRLHTDLGSRPNALR